MRVHSGVIHGLRTALFLLNKPLTDVAHEAVSRGDLEVVTEGSVRIDCRAVGSAQVEGP